MVIVAYELYCSSTVGYNFHNLLKQHCAALWQSTHRSETHPHGKPSCLDARNRNHLFTVSQSYRHCNKSKCTEDIYVYRSNHKPITVPACDLPCVKYCAFSLSRINHAPHPIPCPKGENEPDPGSGVPKAETIALQPRWVAHALQQHSAPLVAGEAGNLFIPVKNESRTERQGGTEPAQSALPWGGQKKKAKNTEDTAHLHFAVMISIE